MPDESGDMTIFAKRLVHNPLLSRKQMAIDIIHTSKVNISKTQIKAKLAKMFKSKEECIAIFGLKFKFGGGRSNGFALIYDSEDARKKNDQKKNLRRDGLWDKKKPHGRKQLKEIKGRTKKLRGTAITEVRQGGGGKKK